MAYIKVGAKLGDVRRSRAAAGTAAFFVLAPGAAAALVPWWLTGWHQGQPPFAPPLRVGGTLLLAAGAAVLVVAFVRFVVEGAGTPAPVAPPDQLVVGGLYRYLRNPIYLAVTACIVGQALLLSSPLLLAYAAAFLAVCAGFVRWYEEPVLRRRFGTQYEAYRRGVPGWLPRLRPWRPEDVEHEPR